jgi:PAS domain S-box-containing protein
MDPLSSFLGRNGFLPHGYCFTWQPSLLWTMVLADAMIAASYFSIPATMLAFLRRRTDVALRSVGMLFGAFIFACGITHLADIWTIWQPDYGALALAKAATAAISLATALALWKLLPQALQIPSVSQLQGVVRRLEAEARQRRSAEEQLADVQQNLAVTLSSIGAGFIATNRAGLVVRMNQVAEQLLGWTEAQARGRSLWQVFQRDGRPAEHLERNPVDVMVEQAVSVQTAQYLTAISRSGQRTAVELKSALTRADDGSVRGLALVLRDLTATQAAAETSARLAAIVESSNDAIIGKTLDGRITTWNRAAQEMFGYSAAEAIGCRAQMLVPPAREAEETGNLARLARGEPVPAFDTQRLTRDGRLIDVSLSMSPVRDAQGRIVGAAEIVRDITPLKQAEQARLLAHQLEVENRQIQMANRLKSQFLANMSHELRTPLNAIIGFADLLHRGMIKPDSPKHHEYLGHIGQSGRHLLQLINDVLDLSKVESGTFEFFPEAVNLPVLVAEVMGVLEAAAQRKRITIDVDIVPALHSLQLDPVRLKQALYNYLSNAIKFTPEDGRVTVRALPEGALRWRLEVQDSGIGIAAADLPLLFGEFVQLDTGPAKRHQGTGLGLALTRRLVEAQGGSVGVRSTPGVGSVFHLVLDRVHGAHADAAVPAPAEGRRLLVIEADAVHQSRLAHALAEAGFVVDGVATGAQALQQAQGQAYGALALDLVLPDQGGLDLLVRIRREGASRATPVLGVSMAVEPGSAAVFPVADVLFKPIRADDLLTALSPLMKSARPARVLVVDDDPLALQLMQATLAGLGMQAVCVGDGHQALAEIAREAPDAVILDLMMPDFDGFQTLDALRRLPQAAQLPVYIWTGMALSDDEVTRLSRSARAVLGKGGGDLGPLLENLRRWRPPGDGKPQEP